MTTNDMERSKIIESSDTIEAIEECYRMGWSDGLPVVPPVDYKVREMLEASGMTGEEEIISLEMRNRVLTSENVAANAVMAGCLPEYFPVLTATLKALEEEKNFVHMASASTSSPALSMAPFIPSAAGVKTRFAPIARSRARRSTDIDSGIVRVNL